MQIVIPIVYRIYGIIGRLVQKYTQRVVDRYIVAGQLKKLVTFLINN